MDYNTFIQHLNKMPRTFIPGLLIKLVKIGYNRNAFDKYDGASNIILKVENRLKNNKR